jgi:hypothetical protein
MSGDNLVGFFCGHDLDSNEFFLIQMPTGPQPPIPALFS